MKASINTDSPIGIGQPHPHPANPTSIPSSQHLKTTIASMFEPFLLSQAVFHVDESKDMLKTVQEMSLHGVDPPPEYTIQELITSFTDSTPTPLSVAIPIIDVSLLSTHEQMEKLSFALSSGGCFQAVGHGISCAFLDKVREVSKQFFELPEEMKQKHSRADHEVEGYGNDLIVSEKQVLDWCNRLFLRVFPEDQRRLNLWPETPNEFSKILHEYATKVKRIMDSLLVSMARSLKLDENSFLNQFGDKSLLQVRFNFYPPCPRPDKVLGVKPHSDRSGITVLLQDKQVEGLQVLKDGAWITVPVIPHALVINLGDQMQIMSNGVFKSPVHRVVTNSEKLRISVAMFNEPEPDMEIGPVEQLMDEKRPRLYRNVKNYASINYESFQKGKVALDVVRV